MTKNDITGCDITTKATDQQAYRDGWDRIFNNNKVAESYFKKEDSSACTDSDSPAQEGV